MRLLDMLTVNRIRDGDVEAFELVINQHKTKIFNYSLRLTTNFHWAEEITQEVFIKIYQHIYTYDWRKASLTTWIYTITHNTCLNYLKVTAKLQPMQILESHSQPGSVEDNYLIKEELDKLNQILNTLSPEDKSLIMLKDYLGFKTKEVAQIMSLPVGTVKSRLHSLRLKVRNMMGDKND